MYYVCCKLIKIKVLISIDGFIALNVLHTVEKHGYSQT